MQVGKLVTYYTLHFCKYTIELLTRLFSINISAAPVTLLMSGSFIGGNRGETLVTPFLWRTFFLVPQSLAPFISSLLCTHHTASIIASVKSLKRKGIFVSYIQFN